MDNPKRVAVIGAGTSGLMAIKCLKEENFEPICFEKTDYIGGLWHFHEEDTEGVPSCMWSTSLNNSKEPGAISDFPPKPDCPNFMRHYKVLQMFTEYAKQFDLLKHIHYKTEVVKVKRAVEYDSTGQWEIWVRDITSGDILRDIFDGVLVCSGHLSLPNLPHFPGMDSFRGKVIHTHSIKKFLGFKDQTVCVVGTGSSGLDAAVEISHVTNPVYLSVRTPAWIATRHGPYGYPLDWTLFNRDQSMLQKYFPLSWCNKFVESIYINPRFSHDLYNIHPERGIACRDPAVNDGISSRMMNGSVVLKKNISHFTQDGVVFCDEAKVTKVDTVVLATGYKYEFPFLEKRDFVKEGSKIHLYKCVYPPHLKHPTLGVIGFIVPMGPGFPCVEMQCRWFAHVLSGKGKLPSRDEMHKDISKQYLDNVKRYMPNDRIYVHIDFADYLDDLATKIGAKPSFLKMFFTDHELFLTSFFGAFVPYQYRLVGPHKWDKARITIMEAGKRMRAALQGDRAFETVESKSSNTKYIIATFMFLTFYLWRKNLINYSSIAALLRMFTFLRKSAKESIEGGIVLYEELVGKSVNLVMHALSKAQELV